MSVTAVERGFQLLRALPASDGTISTLARDTGLPVATVARLMGTLEQVGAVLRVDKKYRIGPALVELVDGHATYDLASLATSHLAELAAFTHETAGVAEAVGDEIIHLAQVATDHDVAVRDWTGVRAAMHHGCIGFVIMASWSDAEVDRYTSLELERFSPHTVTDPGTIRRRLAEARDQGWLWTTDEYAQGVTTVAAPILDRTGRALGCLHAHGPTFRFPVSDEGERDRVGREVNRRARAMSAILGWDG